MWGMNPHTATQRTAFTGTWQAAGRSASVALRRPARHGGRDGLDRAKLDMDGIGRCGGVVVLTRESLRTQQATWCGRRVAAIRRGPRRRPEVCNGAAGAGQRIGASAAPSSRMLLTPFLPSVAAMATSPSRTSSPRLAEERSSTGSCNLRFRTDSTGPGHGRASRSSSGRAIVLALLPCAGMCAAGLCGGATTAKPPGRARMSGRARMRRDVIGVTPIDNAVGCSIQAM